MLKELNESISVARKDQECKVIIITGTGSYYCAGVNLAGALKIMVSLILIDEWTALFNH